MLSNTISAVVHSHKTKESAPFWWLLFHFEMLILAPSQTPSNKCVSIKQIIHHRLQTFISGNIEELFVGTTFNNNWNNLPWQPSTKNGNTAAQIAADADNYRTAITQACTFNSIVTIDKSNISIIEGLYPPPVTPQQDAQNKIPRNTHNLHLPGDICNTIKHCSKNKGTGIFADSIDSFIQLVKLNNEQIQDNISHIFKLLRFAHFFFNAS